MLNVATLFRSPERDSFSDCNGDPVPSGALFSQSAYPA